MSEISKPSGLNTRWAMSGDILDPGTSKYSEGWIVEIPPRQWFNFLDNRQDEAIAHINQHGIAVWDAVTEYQANKSYVQGSNGTVYRALTTNTNINPTTDGGTNWQGLAWFRLATTAEAQAWTNDLTLMSPLKLAEAFKGSNQSLTANGYQKIPGGLVLQWGTANAISTSGGTVPFPIVFPSVCVNVQVCIRDGATDPTDPGWINTATSFTTSQFTLDHGNAARNFFWLAIGF